MRTRTLRRGITVVEVVTAASLMSVVLLGIVSLGVNSGNAWTYGSQRLIADDRASLGLQALCQDIRGGSKATVDSTGTVLTLTSASTNSAGDYDRTLVSYTTTRYYLSGGYLYKQVGTQSAVRMGSKLVGVRFAVSGSKVSVTLTARQQSGGKLRDATMSSDIVLRNPLVE